MRPNSLLSCLLFVLATTANAQTAPRIQPIDRVIAVVNEEAITAVELRNALFNAKANLKKNGVNPPPDAELQKQLLERMILDRAILQYAKDTGIRVDDNQLDAAIARIAEQNRMTPSAFRAAIEKEGINYLRFREDIRSEIIITRVREREIENKVVVTEQEVDNFLTSDANVGLAQEEFNLAHILISIPNQASPEQIQERKKRAEDALAQIRTGANFSQVAATFSNAPDALSGGSLGWRPAARIPDLFLEHLAKMKTNDVSPVLRSPSGFHLIKLIDKRGKDAAVVVEQTRARHILIKTNDLVSMNDAKNRLLQLKERIENGGSFEELARLNSEDVTASKGGDLGWVSPGDTVPDFEKAMAALKPGQVSQPVQSPFGWHLIQVLERRSEDVSRERQRIAARQSLRERKADEVYQDWSRELRDRAYVEFKLEER